MICHLLVLVVLTGNSIRSSLGFHPPTRKFVVTAEMPTVQLACARQNLHKNRHTRLASSSVYRGVKPADCCLSPADIVPQT